MSVLYRRLPKSQSNQHEQPLQLYLKQCIPSASHDENATAQIDAVKKSTKTKAMCQTNAACA